MIEAAVLQRVHVACAPKDRLKGCDERGIPHDPDIREAYLADRRGEGHVGI